MNTSPYANPASIPEIRVDRSIQAVLFSGLATTGLALLGVYLLDAGTDDCHIMGLYGDYVIPAGAMFVGLIASSGYGLASWLTGTRITRALLCTILVFQFAAYFAAQYIEFHGLHLIHPDGTSVGFFEYFDVVARAFAWKQRNGQPGAPLGLWGYAFRGLEVVGFVGGSVIAPLILRKVPYCQSCQRYMKTRELITWAASVRAKKIKKSDVSAAEAHRTEQQQAFDGGKQVWAALNQAASASETAEFQAKLLALQPQKKAATKLPQRLTLKLVHCRRCHSGWLRLDLVSGQGREFCSKEIERVPLEPEFVGAVISPAKQFQS
jgi:hypothetical protein